LYVPSSLDCGPNPREREFFVGNILVRIHFGIVIIWWTGLAPWEFEFPFPGGLISTFLKRAPRAPLSRCQVKLQG
jgi:hypothetical protein